MKGLRISLAALTALLLLAGCGSIGNVLGTGSPYPATNGQSISGNVNYIDYNARRIDLASNGYTTSVYYDNSTQFTLNNQSVSANAIRQGDYITVQAYNNNNGQLIAQNVYDNGGGMASGYPAPYPSGSYPSSSSFTISGTVNYVDTTAQRIDLSSAYTSLRTNGGQGNYSVYYDSRTPVYYQGNTYSPTALERGDQVSITAYDNGGGRYTASSINVTRNVRNQ
jgi:hypothetical protein